MAKKECIAMLLAGGQGSRMKALTQFVAKPAVSFGGKYRIIDFSLSNCALSGIDTVGVLTQYKPYLLNRYIGTGGSWDLNERNGGVQVLPPFMNEIGGNWYRGTADSIYQNIDFISMYDPEYVLILSGDHIYHMDYSLLLDDHKQHQAELTIAVRQVPWEEASRFGLMSTDETGRITEFAEKPALPKSNLASMGIYMFNWPVLRAALLEDEADEQSSHDFGKNVIPRLLAQGKRLFAYGFSGYWQDVGTVESYYEANMQLLEKNPPLNLFDQSLRIFSNTPILPPHFIGPEAKVNDCLFCNGSVILGSIRHSVVALSVRVEEGAQVEDSVLLPGAVVRRGAVVKHSIVGEDAVVPPGSHIGRADGSVELVAAKIPEEVRQ